MKILLLDSFSIVYHDDFFASMAKRVSDVMYELTGVRMPVSLENGQEKSPIIRIGGEERAEYLCYSLLAEGSDITLLAGGEFSAEAAIRRFAEECVTAKKVVTFSDDMRLEGDAHDAEKSFPLHEDAKLRVMSCNALAEWENFGGKIPVSLRSEIFFSAVDGYAPTIIGVQEFSPAWFSAFDTYRDRGLFSVLSWKNPTKAAEDYLTAILYRSDLLTASDFGFLPYEKSSNSRCCVMAWALFTHNESGRKFIFLNTHWDGQASIHGSAQCAETTGLIKLLKQRYNVPVVCTADLNANEQSELFARLTADTELKSVKYEAKELINDIGSWHDLGREASSTLSRDHILASKDVKTLRFETIIRNGQIFASDHSYLVADISL